MFCITLETGVGGVHMWTHTSSAIRTHPPRPVIEKSTLITFYRIVQICTHTSSAICVLHPQFFPIQIILLIKINHQITEYVCKDLHLYSLCLLQYNGAKITTNTWVSDAVELDIDVICQCYTYLLLCFIVLKWLIFI